jgi:RNA polymerase sigma factor (TIGR02999 family)
MTTPSSTRQEVTQLLGDWSGGDEGALEKLFPLVQPELHRLAHHYMSRERAGHPLQTTAILNEAYLRLVENTQRPWQTRTHFVAAAAQLMRRIMVDQSWRVPAGISALADRTGSKNTRRINQKRNQNLNIK